MEPSCLFDAGGHGRGSLPPKQNCTMTFSVAYFVFSSLSVYDAISQSLAQISAHGQVVTNHEGDAQLLFVKKAHGMPELHLG